MTAASPATAATAASKRTRKNSGALQEQLPPDWTSNPSLLRSLHEFIYPPSSKWYWYRRGRVGHTLLSRKYLTFLLYSLLLALCGSGVLMPLLIMATHAWLKSMYQWSATGSLPGNLTELLSDVHPNVLAKLEHENLPPWVEVTGQTWFLVLQCMLSGLATLGVYYASAMHMYRQFYVDRLDEVCEWKCQEEFMAPDRASEERRLGCFNALLAGILGTYLYLAHVQSPFFKLYYEIETRGLSHFIWSTVRCYLWIDFYAYWLHRSLHLPFFYRWIHKWHHRFPQPTPFCAFALHPLEFLAYQSAGILCVAFWETHVLSFLFCVIFVAFHNQIDHSGVDFEGELPWLPSAKYHDDHHKYFHLNFGVHFVTWDWLGGTLRSKEREYGEDKFVGQQDRPKGKTE